MKRALLPLLLAAAAPAYGQAAEAPVDRGERLFPVIGSTPEQCVLGEPTVSSASPPMNVRTIIGRVVRIEELADPATLTTRAASVELEFEAFCNFPSRITLSSDNNGLFRQNAGAIAPVGFASAVPYNAQLRWDDEFLELDANALNRTLVEQTLTISEPSSGPLLLRLSVLPGATNVTTQAPLLSGEYYDIIRITVGPQ